MNENQSTIKEYILIVKTLSGEINDNISALIKGSHGQTEKILLDKSQSYEKAFKENQTDLFLLLSNKDIGKICQVEFYANTNAKFKEWKYIHIFITDGTRVYCDITSEHYLVPSVNSSSVVNVAEPFIESQESFYYIFVKTGNDCCSKEAYPKLTLFGNNERHIEINMNSSDQIYLSLLNNNLPFQKAQFDIFQWQDSNIGNIRRICLQLYSETKLIKCQWPIEWIFIIHHRYSFTGRIMLNRILRTDRFIDMNFEETVSSIPGEYGDLSTIKQKYETNIFSSNILNIQANAISDNSIGRYYVLLRNIEGTDGNVYIEFHGDHLFSSGEEQLSKCENYPDHPFSSKHTDLFHVKATEVGHIRFVSLRLDQTNKEYSLTLDLLYIIHNAIIYEFDLKNITLNKEQPKEELIPKSHPNVEDGKICYYIATHTLDTRLAGTNAAFKVIVTGTQGSFGPIELKDSLTNRTNPFEQACVDLFHIEDIDIGEPRSITITLEPKGLMSQLFSDAKCDRIMLIKSGEYNSLWQAVGDLKSKEPKTITFPLRQQESTKNSNDSTPISTRFLHSESRKEESLLNTIHQIDTPKIKTEEIIETKPIINSIGNNLWNDSDQNNLIMATIEDHQKRHRYAPTLQEAQENYRELRRLLRKMNNSIANEQSTQLIAQKQSINSNRNKSKKRS